MWYRMCESKEEYLKCYRDEMIQYENLAGGTNSSMYFL